MFLKPKLLLALIGLYCSAAYSQGNNASKTIIARLSAFSANYTAEKAYLQFDKPYYAAGDTIYFKAYLTKGPQHQLSSISGVLHVDLINTSDKADQSIKLQLDSGIAWGDFALPDSLPKGNYRIRAYTQWMRNDGENDFFEKIIPIGSIKAVKVPESLIKQPLAAKLKTDVQFFPEGGQLVYGIRSKVAFKAINGNGVGIDARGTVVDNDNRQVAAFASTHLGMGYFYLNPVAGKTYTARVSFANGQQDTFVLPNAETSGIALSVDNDSLPKASVKITANGPYYQENQHKTYTLVIYSGGIVTTVNFKLDSALICLDILKRHLHTGVAVVTLFSAMDEPLCERLLFVQNYDQLNLNLSTDKNSYAKREKVNINLNAVNRREDAAEGHFSVAVTNESIVADGDNNDGNILTHLLLTSDLKGYIEQPGYYFADTSLTAPKNLDILMLAQGYRRFEWKKVLDSTMQTLAYQPEKGIAITGQVKNAFNKPVKNGVVTLISPYKGPVLTNTTDGKGVFHFSDLIFADTAHFVLSAVNASNKNAVKITWFGDNSSAPAIQTSANKLMPQAMDTAITAYIASDKLRQHEDLTFGKRKGILLKQVNIHSKKLDDQYRTASLAGAGHADQVMHADEIAQVQGPITTSLNGRLRGVFFVPVNRFEKAPALGPGGQPMLVIIDGAEVDAADINFLTPNDIETIEVLRFASAAIYGVEGGHGVLVITTKNSNDLSSKDIPSIGVLPIAPMGFYKARAFYAPKYDNNLWVGKQKDLRSTIYWLPELKTDKDGNASFEYYNADGAGTYKVVVEGIDKDGNIGRQVLRYKVD